MFGGRASSSSVGEPKPKPATPTGANEIDFRVGDSLRHTQWGEGMILDLRGQGPDTQATVRFADGGAEKVLLLKWAPVEKI
ncbi:MAG: hypothetical protein V9G12_23825 [Microthrixaceae bacterium]